MPVAMSIRLINTMIFVKTHAALIPIGQFVFAYKLNLRAFEVLTAVEKPLDYADYDDDKEDYYAVV